jgi:hypothetical protein
MTPAGNPIAEAEVVIVDAQTSALTDERGYFTLGVSAGQHLVRIRRIGYRPQYLSATLEANQSLEVSVVLERGPHELPEIEVKASQAKPIEYGWTTKYDDFFRRRLVGLGHFFGRDDIEKRHPLRASTMLAGLPGIRLRFYHPGPSGTGVEFRQCGSVSVWVDGYKQRYPDLPVRRRGLAAPGDAALGEILDRVLPSQIELMEVYLGSSEMPAEFLDDSCAAIAIWTR